MSDFTLYLGNKAYSSWSLRSWLSMKQTGAPFTEVVMPLAPPGQRTTSIAPHSPSGRVPALHHGDITVWESTAIGEYLAEIFPAARLWPEDRAARAFARSISEEMHAGFTALRTAMPMNVRRKISAISTTAAVEADIARILTIWRQCRARPSASAGPFLFGTFTNADAMFAPVATRLRTYAVPLDGITGAYVEAIHAHPFMGAWIEAARKEDYTIEAYEAV